MEVRLALEDRFNFSVVMAAQPLALVVLARSS
jgi:hypothetical protein